MCTLCAALVAPRCLEAMKEAMEEFSGAARRVLDGDKEESIVVMSCALARAQLLAGDGVVAGTCHLDVRITARESFVIFDYHTNEAVEPFDGRERIQESIWRFEGVVSPEVEDPAWRLYAIV